MNETGLVRNPSRNAPPRNTSRYAARCNSHIGGIDMFGTTAGNGGYPNSFWVPAMKKTSPATMRSTLNIRDVQMERDGSKIDISCSPFLMISFGGSFLLLVISRPLQHKLALAGVSGHRRGALEFL